MKPYKVIIIGVELVLIAVISGAGAYAFLSSGIYGALRDYGIMHNIGFIPYLHLIIWGILTAFGIVRVVLNNKGSGSFAVLNAMFSLPSLLAYNTINWPGILHIDYKFTSSMGFGAVLATGVLIITGYIALNYLRLFRKNEESMAARRVNREHIEAVYSLSGVTLLVTLCSAVAAAIITGLLAFYLESLTLDYLRKIPWNVVFTGAFCFLLIAFYIYWFFARRRTGAHLPQDSSDIKK